MNELTTLAIMACIIVTLVAAGYGIGMVCSWWDRKREVRRLHRQRKDK